MSADAGWNAGGERPCDVLERIAQVEDPSARIWKESDIPTVEQGVRVLGTALGQVDFVGGAVSNVFFQRIPLVADVQSVWSSCVVLVAEPMISFESSGLNSSRYSLQVTTKGCGSALERFRN